jgi:hypothetical protein
MPRPGPAVNGTMKRTNQCGKKEGNGTPDNMAKESSILTRGRVDLLSVSGR